MRYGLVRRAPALPTPSEQRLRIDGLACDVVLEEGAASSASQRNLFRLLNDLRLGDELVVVSLDALEASTGELVKLLRRFSEVGAKVLIVGGAQVETIAPMQPIPRLLTLLAEHEARRPCPHPTRRRARPGPARLSRHQLLFARDLRRRGASLREIGLIFRLSPNELSELLGDTQA